MIYDCFTFFNELDLLEIRLNILDDVVDKFVLVEATKTFSNRDKPLYFNENRKRFEKFKNKIIHVIVDDFPAFDIAWNYEFYQRNAIARGLKQCKEDDVILISDVDEIPNPVKVIKYKKYPGVKVFKQKMFYYYLNNINIRNPFWTDLSTKMLFYSDFLKNEASAQKVRFLKGKVINEGGWHFSYLGGAESIALKIKSFAHQEFNLNKYTDLVNIKKRVEKGEDLYSQKKKKIYVGIEVDKTFPKYIVENVYIKYKNLICDKNIKFYDKLVLYTNKIKINIIVYIKNSFFINYTNKENYENNKKNS